MNYWMIKLLLRQLNVAKKIRRTKGWIARKRKEAMPEHRRLTMTKQPALWTSRFWQYLVAGVIIILFSRLRSARLL